jgi:hypothetical protein
MATIARATLDACGVAPWDDVAERIRSWAKDEGLALRDVVVLLPFVQLLAPARRSFAGGGGWMPRIETTWTLAASLGPPPRRGAGESAGAWRTTLCWRHSISPRRRGPATGRAAIRAVAQAPRVSSRPPTR